MKHRTLVLLLSLAALTVLDFGCSEPTERGDLREPQTYYVDCEGGDDANEGTSQGAPWNSLRRVNTTEFRPGDSILLKRGTRCEGMLWPKGSGTAHAQITLGAYGTGALPIVSSSDRAALRLFNQQYWHIEHLETVGGNPYGIWVSGDREGILRHFRIRDVVVHGVRGPVVTKRAGLIAFAPSSTTLTFEDIVIDGATCYDSTQWSGIVVEGGYPPTRDHELYSRWDRFWFRFVGRPEQDLRAENVTIRNSTVHDVAGDGIILFRVRNGLLEHNVSWKTGMQYTFQKGGQNPNGIWTWKCEDCTVQFNEGYLADTPGVDGGVYDIDWGSRNNIVQYNFAHDSQGYCVAVFGANGVPTINSIVRYNVCVRNGQSPRQSERQGEIWLYTWNGGSLDGVQVYNNTIYWSPPLDVPALKVGSADGDSPFTGERPNLFQNNFIYSRAPTFLESTAPIELNHNAYVYEGAARPKWIYREELIHDLSDFEKATGHGGGSEMLILPPNPGESASNRAEIKRRLLDQGADLGEVGTQDTFGAPLPLDKTYDIGAREFEWEAADQGRESRNFELSEEYRDHHLLVSFLDARRTGAAAALSRSQLVFLKSMDRQFADRGLKVVVVVRSLDEPPELENLRFDWNLGDLPLLRPEETPLTGLPSELAELPSTLLFSPGSRLEKEWVGYVTAQELWLELASRVGPEEISTIRDKIFPAPGEK